MMGPLFRMELLRGSRRGRLHTLQQVYAGWLILQFTVLFLGLLSAATFRLERPFYDSAQVNVHVLSRFINSYTELFVIQHFILILLVTPAFVAGAIAEEKARGTLQHLLVARVSSWEIIAGKGLGRMAQVVLLALAGLPLISFMGGFGHFDRQTLLALAVVGVAPLFALGSASVFASVVSQRARDAVVRVYLWLTLGVLLIWAFDGYAASRVAPLMQYGLPLSLSDRWFWRLGAALACLNPRHVLAPAWEQNQEAELLRRTLTSAWLWGSVGIVCLVLAVWRLRPACLRQLEESGSSRSLASRRRQLPMTDDAMRWKEREIEGMAVFPWLRRVPRWLGMFLVAAGTVYLFYCDEDKNHVPQGLVVVLAASLVVGIRASTGVCGERERQTWDLLLLSPLEPRELIGDKHRGILDACRPYFLAYAAPAIVMAALLGFAAFFWTMLYLLVAWAAVYFMAALGLYWSARCRNSWRSLLATVGVGYAHALLLTIVSFMTFGLAGIYLSLVLLGVGASRHDWLVFEYFMPAAVGFGVSWLLRFRARAHLTRAENWIAVRERVWSNDNRQEFGEDEFRRLCLARDLQELRRTS